MEPITKDQMEACRQDVTQHFTNLLSDHIEDEEARYARIEAQLQDVASNLQILMRLFEQSKGALSVFRYLALMAAGVWAFVIWANDHIKL